MATWKRKNGNGNWDYLSLTGEDVTTLKSDVLNHTSQLASNAKNIRSIMKYGSVGDGIVNDSIGFNAAIADLPAKGGILLVSAPPTIYHLATPVIFGNKDFIILIDPNAKFDDLTKLPTTVTNSAHAVKNTYLKSSFTGGVIGQGDVTLSTEAVAESGSTGNVVSGFFGTMGHGSGDIWALNPIVQAGNGFTGSMQGVEIDVDSLTGNTASLINGLIITGVGSFPTNNNRAIMISRDINSRWQTGLFVVQSNDGIVVEGATNYGIQVRGQNGSAIVVTPKDDVVPDSNMIYGTDPSNSAIRYAIKKDGGAFFNNLRIGSATSSKITLYTVTVPNITVPNIPAQSTVDVSVNVGTSVDKYASLTANPVDVPSGVIWSVTTSGGNAVIRFANVTTSLINSFACDCIVEAVKH